MSIRRNLLCHFGFPLLTGSRCYTSFLNLSRPIRGPGSVKILRNPGAMPLGLPAGAETEMESVIAAPSTGIVGYIQTPD